MHERGKVERSWGMGRWEEMGRERERKWAVIYLFGVPHLHALVNVISWFRSRIPPHPFYPFNPPPPSLSPLSLSLPLSPPPPSPLPLPQRENSNLFYLYHHHLSLTPILPSLQLFQNPHLPISPPLSWQKVMHPLPFLLRLLLTTKIWRKISKFLLLDFTSPSPSLVGSQQNF